MSSAAHEFVSQAREHLAVLEQLFLSLEKPESAELESSEQVDRSLRIVHSIKGDAGFLGFTSVRTLANAIESVMERLREAPTLTSPQAVERLLAARDRLATLIDDLDHSNEADIGELIAQLGQVERRLGEREALWEVDLAEVAKQRGGRLAEFFASLARLGALEAPELDIAPEDLVSRPLQGPVRLRGLLSPSTTPEQLRRELGLPLTSPGGPTLPQDTLRIDLAAWAAARNQGLATLLAELAQARAMTNPRLELSPQDLTDGLGTGGLVLHGDLLDPGSAAELASRLRLPGSDRPRAREEGPRPRSVAAPVPGSSPSEPAPTARAEPETTRPRGESMARGGNTGEADRTSSLRINVELLDRLMTLTSELTLIRNQSLLAFDQDDSQVRPIVQRLDAVTSALQETVLRTRMQPIGNLFGKFPRVVRDLGRQLGKQVEMTIVGREVELDKTILEQLSDPLTHLVRNSVDHGIEVPEVRLARGKPAVGRITLSAAHEEGQIRIEIRDDGKGIDPQAVREKALAMRLKTEAELDRMSPRELYSLILLPGFSTARSVSEVSGRGVGMDVVKTNIELLEGSLTIDSHPGLGTSMILRMPLTLAIIPCLIVNVDGDRYAIPQRELEEAVCLHPGLKGRIERAFDKEVYRLRGRLLPIVRMADVLARSEPFDESSRVETLARHEAEHDPDRISYILVLKTGGRRFGLVVDAVRGTEEIVVKPMHPSIKKVGIFAGSTIMGDGRVALIADVAGIVEHARLTFEKAVVPSAADEEAGKGAQTHRVLLFENGPDEQFALPLLQIRRIEMVDLDRIERVGEHEYVTVDGVSMRVLRLDKVMPVSAPAAESSTARQVPLILPKFVSQPMAVLVSRIVDTESLAVELQSHPEHDQGLLGSAIVRGRMTLFLDIHRLSERLLGRPAATASPPPTRGSRSKRLLVVDDTPFFLEVVKRYLTSEGHEVETAVNGEEGLKKLDQAGPFDLIVSDIEMPVMDGWQFAREVRRKEIKTPMLALTSLSGVGYEVKARDCGFDSYEVKLDHDRLVRKVKNLLLAQEVLA
ncbi:MAG: hybrid sensor histidine kinase/response regulator [Isosphaeraceae bacterium]